MLKNLTKQAVFFFLFFINDRDTTQGIAVPRSVFSARPTLQAVTVSYLIRINITLGSILFNNMYIYTRSAHTNSNSKSYFFFSLNNYDE